MITQELINTELGAILADMGYPVCNAARYKEELGERCPSDEDILIKKAQRDLDKAILTAGYNTGLGFSINITDNDKLTFTKLATKLSIDNTKDTDNVEISDIHNVKHLITYAQFKQTMSSYILL